MLFQHQSRAVEYILEKGSCAIFYEMGLGKTLSALAAFNGLRFRDPRLKMLVVAPLSLLGTAWPDDIARFTDLRYHNFHDDGLPTSDFDVLAINFEALIQEKNLKFIRRLCSQGPWMIVVDESSRMKDPRSKTTKTLLEIRDLFKYRVVMSGTPAPNSETEYWGQMEFVKPGLLHPSFYAFRNTFFQLERNGQVMIRQGSFINRHEMSTIFKQGWKYGITPANQKRLMTLVDSVSIRAKKIDCLDLPEQIDEVRKVELTAPQRKAYNDMKRHLIAEIQGKEIAAMHALTKIMKLREITSGFLLTEDGMALDIGESVKLTELQRVIEEAGDQQIIVWANFQHEIRKIREALKAYGRVVTLYADTDDRTESIKDFQNGHARFLVAHPRSAAHGLTFVNCSMQVFFSLDWSWEAYEQARARTHRAGQHSACVYVHLVAKDSVDEKILECLRSKRDIQEVLWSIVPQRIAA